MFFFLDILCDTKLNIYFPPSRSEVIKTYESSICQKLKKKKKKRRVKHLVRSGRLFILTKKKNVKHSKTIIEFIAISCCDFGYIFETHT